MALDNYKIAQSDINAVHVEGVQGEALTGSVTENKRVFDKYPDMIARKFNDLVGYIGTIEPSGDTALNYSSSEVYNICKALGCSEGEITL